MSETPEQALIRRMREQRMSWVTLNDATTPPKRVRIIRPTELELAQYFIKDGAVAVGADEVKRFSVDWSGFTEADLLGPAIGGSDPVPFSPVLWAELVSDRVEWLRKLATELLDLIIHHRSQARDEEKNS